MSGSRRSCGRRTAILAAALGAVFLGFLVADGPAVSAAASQAERDAETGAGVVPAIRCWRRVGRNAVYVGERFDMLVTCGVAETEAARAVPDLAGLEPESLAVSPFEVLEGERYDDLVRGPQRFFQYRYTLRILGEDYFGADVELPALNVRYRIERSLDGGPVLEGRELTYALPPEPVRVLALVPVEVADIRELPGETFGDAEARLFRASFAALGAAVLAFAAVAVALAAGFGIYRARRGLVMPGVVPLADWRVADGALGELVAVRREIRGAGWSAAEVARAVAAFRVAGAVALGRPPVQSPAGGAGGAYDGAGQFLVRRGRRRRGAAVRVSSAVTPTRLDCALQSTGSELPRDVPLAETVRDALRVFGAVRYGRPIDPPPAALTAQLDRALAALTERVRRSTPRMRRLAGLRGRHWKS